MQLNISIASSDADAEKLEQLTVQLKEELSNLHVNDVNIPRNVNVPEGAKAAGALSWGTLLVTLAASGGIITTLINVIQTWLSRNERRSVSIELDGDKLELSGISDDDQQQIIDLWIERQLQKQHEK